MVYSASWKGPVPVGSLKPVVTNLHVFLVQDEPGGVGELGQEIGLGRVNGEADSMVVHHLDTGDLGGCPVEPGLDANDVVQVLVNHRRDQVRVGTHVQ